MGDRRRGVIQPPRLPVLAAIASVMAVACADPSSIPPLQDGPWIPAESIATRAELTCATNGSATLSAGTVQPKPDGVHIRVINEYDEPVSVEGFDANPGVTDWVFSHGPGTMELMCWPFSQHSSGEEPDRHPLEIIDPLDLYVDGSLPCEIEQHTIVEWAEAPIDEGPPPLDIAWEVIDGLRADDVLRVAGYPDQEGGAVIVIRDGEIVGRYRITRFEGEPWDVSGGSACEDTGLPYEGQSWG